MRRAVAPLLIACLAAATAGPGSAGERSCKTSIEGTISEITYDTADDAVAQNRSLSERAWAMFGNDTCPGYVTLRAMTPELTDAERGPFCLLYDPEEKTFTGFSQGERDRYLLCTESRSFCERVNAGTDAALRVAGLGEDATAADAAGAAADAALNGPTAVQQGYETVRDTAAGATIITGTGAGISSALSSAGTAAMAAVTAPAALAAAAVSVVAVGGAVYVCH